MREEKGEKDIFQGDDDFLGWVAQEVCSDDYRESLRNIEQGPHPIDEMLYEYVWGGLNEQETRIIRAHIAFCGSCAEEVLRLRLAEEELEERVLDWANEEDICLTLSHLPQGGTPLKGDAFEQLATEFWEPQWIEQQATAADFPEQKHVFRQEDGDITVSCVWRSKYRSKPAYISIAWKANITTRKELCAHFVNPETRQQLTEVSLGTCLVGEEVFTSDELGFDPSCERWAVALLVKEVKA
jgi:hypothetical protein